MAAFWEECLWRGSACFDLPLTWSPVDLLQPSLTCQRAATSSEGCASLPVGAVHCLSCLCAPFCSSCSVCAAQSTFSPTHFSCSTGPRPIAPEGMCSHPAHGHCEKPLMPATWPKRAVWCQGFMDLAVGLWVAAQRLPLPTDAAWSTGW